MKIKVDEHIESAAFEKAKEEYSCAQMLNAKYGRPIKEDCIIGGIRCHLMNFVHVSHDGTIEGAEKLYSESFGIRTRYAKEALEKVKRRSNTL